MAPHETMQAYARRIAGDDADLRILASAVSAACYGRRKAIPEAAQRMQIAYNNVYLALNPVQKVKLLVSRMRPHRSLRDILKSLPQRARLWLRKKYAEKAAAKESGGQTTRSNKRRRR